MEEQIREAEDEVRDYEQNLRDGHHTLAQLESAIIHDKSNLELAVKKLERLNEQRRNDTFNPRTF